MVGGRQLRLPRLIGTALGALLANSLFTACGGDVVRATGDDGSGGIDPTPGQHGTTGDDGLDSSGPDDLDGDGTTGGEGTSTGAECETDCGAQLVCGDGILSDGETCDDGNARPGDGCSGVCAVEPNHRCQTPGQPCVSTIVCGDGEIGGGEACDDDNTMSGDGCSSSCAVEPGYVCPAPGMPCEETSTSDCGNGMVEFPETCDDGDEADADGCSSTCTLEPGYTCPTPGEPCIEDEFCGNGIRVAPEECDDMNGDPGDGCDGNCRQEPYHECPEEGGPCTSLIVCGDLQVVADETCDDGLQCSDGTDCTTDPTVCAGVGDGTCAPRAGDGCAASCRQVEPGWRCPTEDGQGGACEALPEPMCGDGNLDRGEYCDDGNLDPDDGCTDRCQVTPGYDCPTAGVRCERISWCGDGVRRTGEQCDDGSVCQDGTDCTADASICVGIGDDSCQPRGADGCSTSCVVEAGYRCRTEGGACVSLYVCGDGLVGGSESCDLGGRCEDGTTDCTADPSVCAGIGDGACLHTDRAGCADCVLDLGWRCSPGGTCRAAACGDGIVAGLEFCDDGSHCEDGSSCTTDADCPTGACEARPDDGCGTTCALEEGWRCDVPGEPCQPTVCGDGVAEGTEQCDDGNYDLGDGCTPFCQAEPLCDQGPCTSQCGDGIRFADEDCDDGNQRDGDGCSSICGLELGFQCSEPTALPSEIIIPLVVRDFHGVDASDPADEHPDFETSPGEPGNGPGTVNDIVRDDGADCFFDDGGDADPANDRIRGGDLGCAGEVQVMRDSANAPVYTASLQGKPIFANPACDRPNDSFASKCINSVKDAESFHQWYTDRPEGVNIPQWNSNPTTLLPLPLVNGRFSATGVYTAGGNAFSFDSRSMSVEDPSPTGSEPGFFPIDDLQLTGATCSSSSFNHNFHFTSEVRYWFEYDAAVSPTLTFSGDDDVWVYVNGFLALDLGGIHGRLEGSFTLNSANAAAWGLRDGNIYEIAVFQAERNQCASNYWLTLDGFVPRTSVCESECGDGMVASTEECDDGVNSGAYETCNADCTLAPYCGDGSLDADDGEVCDAGAGFVVYGGTDQACGPDCQYAPYCGDGSVDGGYGEACDDSTNDGTYGTCNPDCTLAPYCGDGAATDGEACDDGIANGTSSSACRSDCQLKCGDGAVDPGEECDAGEANASGYEECQLDCTLGPYCGDGIRQSGHEQCDDGLNNGDYGTCAPMCVLGPRCGDGSVQSDREVCDNGGGNVVSGYGDPDGCTTRCLPVPYCGDRAVTNGETCDDGVNSGMPGSCLTDCSGFVPLTTCGNGQRDAGEQCDAGAANGTAGSSCDANCRNKCGNGRIDAPETCDDGVNDGSYGSCAANCTFAGYCGDGLVDGPEDCDRGASNETNPYGQGLCTLACEDAPYCGDGRVQTAFGEECDGQTGCTSRCRVFIP